MQLRTRIILLFVGLIVGTAALTIMHYMTHSLMIGRFEDALDRFNEYLARYDHGAFFDPEYFLLTTAYQLTDITSEFAEYRSQIYTQTVVSVIGVMVVFALGFTSLKRHMINRLDAIRGFVGDTYEHGPSYRRLQLSGKDELSQIAKLMNTALNVLEAAKAEAMGRDLEGRKMLLSLIRQSSVPVAYYRASGDLMGSNLEEDMEGKISELIRPQFGRLQKMKDEFETLDFGDHELILSWIGPRSGTRVLLEVKPVTSA